MDRILNAETDAELKTRAMNYIMREICLRYRSDKKSSFSVEDIQGILNGLGEDYIRLNIIDLFRGSGLLDIQDNSLALNNEGKKVCDEN
jgi:hypothetical protein